MITGNIENGLYSRIHVAVVTPAGSIVEKFLIDTGFDYGIAMHYDEVDKFNLEIMDFVEVEYASGEVIEEIYCHGKVIWFGETKDVRTILSNDEEPALGTRLFSGCVVNMDFIQNQLTIDKPLP